MLEQMVCKSGIQTCHGILHHWAWLHRGYWRYKSLIDCLIDWLILFFVTLIWKAQNYLQLFLCPVVPIIAITGIADIDLTRLQRVQNQLARLVTKSPPFTCSFPLLHSVHWLPVKFRIFFNISLLTYTNPSWKAACLSSCHACRITSVSFTEIRPRN